MYGHSKQRVALRLRVEPVLYLLWRACASSLCTVRRCQLCSCCCPRAILSSSVERLAEPW